MTTFSFIMFQLCGVCRLTITVK